MKDLQDRSTRWTRGFQTVDAEVHVDALPVRGDFPSWISGALIRVGPSRFEVGGRTLAHWFDGLAMLHRFGFEAGRVSYRSRFLRSDAYRAAEGVGGGAGGGAGAVAHSGFMTDPCRTLFGRVASWFGNDATDNANVAVRVADGVGVAMTETPLAVRFDPDTLRTLGPHVRAGHDAGAGGQVAIAHPLHDGRGLYTYAVVMGRHSVYRVLVEEGGTRRTLAEVACPRPAYMHSFGMSARYLVLAEFPLRVNPVRLKFSNEPFIRNYRWEPALGTVFTVIDKASGAVAARARGDACFGFHHVDAHEADGHLRVDLLAYPDASIIDALRLERLRAGEPVDAVATLTRFSVPLGAGTDAGPDGALPVATRERLCGTPIELPRTDERRRRAGLPARIVWGNGLTVPGQFIDDVTRIDLSAVPPGVRTWHEPGCHPGEPVFVPRPGSTAEGDGVLLSLVLDARANRSFLVVLDATTLEEIARATLPHAVPYGFHGEHVPARDR